MGETAVGGSHRHRRPVTAAQQRQIVRPDVGPVPPDSIPVAGVAPVELDPAEQEAGEVGDVVPVRAVFRAGNPAEDRVEKPGEGFDAFRRQVALVDSFEGVVGVPRRGKIDIEADLIAGFQELPFRRVEQIPGIQIHRPGGGGIVGAGGVAVRMHLLVAPDRLVGPGDPLRVAVGLEIAHSLQVGQEERVFQPVGIDTGIGAEDGVEVEVLILRQLRGISLADGEGQDRRQRGDLAARIVPVVLDFAVGEAVGDVEPVVLPVHGEEFVALPRISGHHGVEAATLFGDRLRELFPPGGPSRRKRPHSVELGKSDRSDSGRGGAGG